MGFAWKTSMGFSPKSELVPDTEFGPDTSAAALIKPSQPDEAEGDATSIAKSAGCA